MILWPTVAVVGFVLLTGLVIAMGTRSTARYEQERESAMRTPAVPAEAMRAA